MLFEQVCLLVKFLLSPNACQTLAYEVRDALHLHKVVLKLGEENKVVECFGEESHLLKVDVPIFKQVGNFFKEDKVREEGHEGR